MQNPANGMGFNQPFDQRTMPCQRLFHWLKPIALVLAILLTQCKSAILSDHLTLDPSKLAPVTLEIVNEELEPIRDTILQAPEARQIWQQKTAFVAPGSDWAGWVTELKLAPSLDLGVDHYVVNPVRIPAQEEVHGYLLVKNSWYKPHSLRIIFLFDFQQIPVLKDEQGYDFYDLPVMQPQEERAAEFVLPALPEGFHHFSYVLVADPDNTTTDQDYRISQQHSFQEHRYELWIGIDEPPENTPLFETWEMGQAATSRVGLMDVVLSVQAETNEPLTSLTLKPGETYLLALRLFNCGVECRKTSETNAPYTGPVPLRIAVLWNDRITQITDYDLLAEAPDNLTLEIEVNAPTGIGSYQLSLVAFTFPDYSQFTYDPLSRLIEQVMPYQGIFSRRILVEVQP